MAHRLQFRRDTRARWLEIDPVLLEGEVGYEIDTKNGKVGDGIHAYSELPYNHTITFDSITPVLGDSSTLVPSQKLVTDNFERIEEIIKRAKEEVENTINEEVEKLETSDATHEQQIAGLQASTFEGEENADYYKLTWFTSSGGPRDVKIPTYNGKKFPSIENVAGVFMADSSLVHDILDYVYDGISEETKRAKTAEQVNEANIKALNLFVVGFNTNSEEVVFDAYEVVEISPSIATSVVAGGKIVYVRNPNTDILIANGFFYKLEGKYYTDAVVNGVDLLLPYRESDRTLYKDKNYVCDGIRYVVYGDFLVKSVNGQIVELNQKIEARPIFVQTTEDAIEDMMTNGTWVEGVVYYTVEE